MTTEGTEARIHNVRRHYRLHRLRRTERLERLLIRAIYHPTLPLTLKNDIREELNRGPEDRLKSAPSRVCREGKAAVAAFQRDNGQYVVGTSDYTAGGTG